MLLFVSSKFAAKLLKNFHIRKRARIFLYFYTLQAAFFMLYGLLFALFRRFLCHPSGIIYIVYNTNRFHIQI